MRRLDLDLPLPSRRINATGKGARAVCQSIHYGKQLIRSPYSPLTQKAAPVPKCTNEAEFQPESGCLSPGFIHCG